MTSLNTWMKKQEWRWMIFRLNCSSLMLSLKISIWWVGKQYENGEAVASRWDSPCWFSEQFKESSLSFNTKMIILKTLLMENEFYVELTFPARSMAIIYWLYILKLNIAYEKQWENWRSQVKNMKQWRQHCVQKFEFRIPNEAVWCNCMKLPLCMPDFTVTKPCAQKH